MKNEITASSGTPSTGSGDGSVVKRTPGPLWNLFLSGPPQEDPNAPELT